MTTTIILGSKTTLGKTETYYLTKASKKACEKLEENPDLVKKGVNNDKAIMVAFGDGMKKPRNINSILELEIFYENTGGVEQVHYRNYQESLESQKSKAHMVNMCIDTNMSWQSALRAIGYNNVRGLNTPAHTTAYCVLWKVED